MKQLLPLVILLLAACGQQTLIPEVFDREKAVVEIRDMYQAGQFQIDSALSNFPELEKVILKSRDQVLVIFLTLEKDDGEFERVQQSGVFIRDGRFVLTVGHGFYMDDAVLTKVEARLVSGHELLLEPVHLYYEAEKRPAVDYAILQPIVPYSTKGFDASSGGGIAGDVIIMGFPGGLGLDNAGGVIHVREVAQGGVYPLAVLCDRLLMNPHILRPMAGAIPIRGMSGAPVLDEQGGLVGLFSSVSRTRSITGWHYIFEMSEVPWSVIDSLVLNLSAWGPQKFN